MRFIATALLILTVIACQKEEPVPQSKKEVTMEYAKELAHKLLIIDTHVDLPERLINKWEDISQRTENGHVDYPRLVEGGVNAPFMAIYIPASRDAKGTGKELADSLIDMVESFQTKWPDKFKIVKSQKEVRECFEKGIIALPLGIENGTAIKDDIGNLKHFYDRGVRYMTLTHSKNNLLGGSSFDFERTWDGLTDFGKDVIKEMNHLGMMVDISHVSDSTFWDVMKVTKTPPIASHSSCRFFTPGMERNISDDMIKAVAEKGGLVMINFGSYFINWEYREKMDIAWDYVGKHKLQGQERIDYYKNFKKENNVPMGTVTEVAAHIKHVADLV